MRPVKVAGSTVARATLHNLDEVRRKDIRIGDHVILQKAGDVIPEVVRPLLEKRTGDEREYQMPAECPVCGTPVVRDEGAVRHYCPNLACPARVGQEYGHFVGRGGMDIEGAGWVVLTQLLQRGMVKRRGDFYRLSVDELKTLERFARKSAENLYAAIQRSRRRPLERILASLGIPQVGWTTAIELAAWLAAQVPATPMGASDGLAAGAGSDRVVGGQWLRRAAELLERTATEEPTRFEEIQDLCRENVKLQHCWLLPHCSVQVRHRRPKAPSRARPSSSPGRYRSSRASPPRTRSVWPAARPPDPCRARPTMSSRARTRAPSS